LQGDLNAGLIIPLHQTLHASLSYMPLMREPLLAAVPEEWMRSGRLELSDGKLCLRDVADEPLVLFPRRSAPAFHDIITTYFVANGIQPTIGQEAIQMQTIISLVSAGMGIALVPGSLRKLGRSGVRYVPLDGRPPTIETGLVWRRDDVSPTVSRLVEVARMVSARGEGEAQPAAGMASSLADAPTVAMARNGAAFNGVAHAGEGRS
jgi:DNA-binding transcriptional LysR family regulator